VKTALRIPGYACLAVAVVWALLGLRVSGWNLRGAWRSVQVMMDGPNKKLPPGAFDMSKPIYLAAIGIWLLSLAS
jgi:hypothetical protein